MAKIFTITEGVENLGALKSGGQGSVYKARKSGEIITAIKILPTPISSETEDDKNFTSFQNEVQKLKKVNEIPNPNVVGIIASGITSSGNLPYIEMEYIEGPDLGELLKPPYEPIFTIKETIKVADQLANALAHCHRADVKHGDIKSNNVKHNQHTGNYILLDFGLSVMSDEQRRTSIRYAGAIEFMAPEQSAGEMLFETDIYSFGIILFELLGGTVPFPLSNKGEMARNSVMIAHMETLPPDIVSLRRNAIPLSWSNDKREKEMQVPVWLLSMIYKCLEKDPAKRFKNGSELQEFIHSGIVTEECKKATPFFQQENLLIQNDESELRKEIRKLELQLAEKEERLKDLQYEVEVKDKELYQVKYMDYQSSSRSKGVSKTIFFIVFFIGLGLAGFTGYNTFIKPVKEKHTDTLAQNQKQVYSNADSSVLAKQFKKQKGKIKKVNGINNDVQVNNDIHPGRKYRVVSNAYFYLTPDKNRRRTEYIPINNGTLTSINETNDFIFVSFVNSAGKASKGWLLKKDLLLIE